MPARRVDTRRAGTVLALIAGLALVSSACGPQTSRSSSTPRGPATTSTGAASTAPTATPVRIRVLAAASLTSAFQDIGVLARAGSAPVDAGFEFAGSGTLVTQLENGAEADVVATADTKTMQRLVDAHLVEAPQTFATNHLEILVAPHNPKGVRGLADLARPDLRVVLGDTSVPAGDYARRILSAAGVSVHPVSLELDVKAAVSKVTSGEADATIVYETDVSAAGSRGTGITVPASQNLVATYPIAVLRSTRHGAASQAFVRLVLGEGQKVLERHGFSARP